jgi:hypothetical protein
VARGTPNTHTFMAYRQEEMSTETKISLVVHMREREERKSELDRDELRIAV